MKTVSRDLETLFGEGAIGGLSDEQLLGRFVARRDEAAFEALVLRHGTMVWGVCRRVLRDHHDAEDAFQAAFLVLAHKAASIAHREMLANWLYAVAHQTAMKARSAIFRRRKREHQVPDMPEPEPVQQDPVGDFLQLLDQEISRLPERYRMPIILCDLEGSTHREAAAQLGWPIGTVSGRLSRARALLARRLSRRGLIVSGGSLALLISAGAVKAGPPASLVASTVKHAAQFAVEGTAKTWIISTKVAALADGMMKTMFLTRLKIAVAMLLAVALSGTVIGASILIYQTRANVLARANPQDDVGSLPSVAFPTFDGITFERILSKAVNQPLFVDLDNGRVLSPPFDLEPAVRGQSSFLPNISWTAQLTRWVRDQGIDAALQTDGREVTLLGLKARTAALLPLTDQALELTPAAILKRVGEARETVKDKCVTFKHVFGPGQFGSRLPFVTREDGVGWVAILGFADPSLQGPDSIMLDYQIVRGFKTSDAADLKRTGQRRVPESPILGEFAGFLVIEILSEDMVLRQPGSNHRIVVGKKKVVVWEGGRAALEAARLYTGYLDIDAPGNLVTLDGRGVRATFSRTGGRVHVSMDKRSAEAARVVVSMPELRFLQDMKWGNE
jgi:RNA polymerase sigma factor (sigma-70 family)